MQWWCRGRVSSGDGFCVGGGGVEVSSWGLDDRGHGW